MKTTPRPAALPLALLAATVVVLAGCATTDLVYSAQKSFDRALRNDSLPAFFQPVLARSRAEPAPAGPRPQAKQHYLAMVAALTGLSPRDQSTLRREGLLGDAFVSLTVAQWRLGRLADARTSAQLARASGQEALDSRARALFEAFEGVSQLESALDVAQSGAGYAALFPLLAGENGAWNALGEARTEVPRQDPLQLPLMQVRLAAFKILKDARAAQPAAATAAADGEEAWQRVRAAAQIELAELAAFPARDGAAHATLVRHWQVLGGLDPVAR